MSVRLFAFDRVFDRTPVPLRPTSDFRSVRKKPVHVRTVEAIGLFDPVQISEETAVENDVVAPLHPLDSVQRERRVLEHREEEVEHDGGNDHRVDERRREDVSDFGGEKVVRNAFPHVFLEFLRFFRKHDFSVFDGVVVALHERFVFGMELRFEFVHPLEDVVDLGEHGRF